MKNSTFLLNYVLEFLSDAVNLYLTVRTKLLRADIGAFVDCYFSLNISARKLTSNSLSRSAQM